MLVCNVSQRPPRRAIAAGIAETGTAVDDLGLGNIVFATLVDDPASVAETVDAYLGEIMLEAASAAVVLDANIPATYAAAVVETASAADTQDGTAAVVAATFDGVSVDMTLSNGNRTATHSLTSTSASGARSTSLKSSGKYYFEITIGAMHGGNDSLGILLSSGTYNDQTAVGSNCTVAYVNFAGSTIYSNGSNSGYSLGGLTTGDVLCVAIDLTNRKAWFRKNGLTWLNSAGSDPATNVGGAVIGTGSFSPSVAGGGGGSVINDNVTANFGQSAFAYAVPSGFGNWPA